MTTNLGIGFKWEANPTLVRFSDADFANCSETRRSTTGFCMKFCGGPISWKCQRQAIVTLSTTEAEYVSGCELVKELLPTRETLIELGMINESPTKILIENQSTVKIANNECGQRTKHIDIRQKWLNEQTETKRIEVKHVRAERQAVDIFTKPLHKTKFINNRDMLMTMTALCTLITTVCCHRLAKTEPLDFITSGLHYFEGRVNQTIQVYMPNPCRIVFGHMDEANPVVKRCKRRFETEVLSQPDFCSAAKTLNHAHFNSKVMSPIESMGEKNLIPYFIAITRSILRGTESILKPKQENEKIATIHDLKSKVKEELSKSARGLSELKAIRQMPIKPEQLEDLSGVTQTQEEKNMITRIHDYEHLFFRYGIVLSQFQNEMKNGTILATMPLLKNEPINSEAFGSGMNLIDCIILDDPDSLSFNLTS